MAKAPSSVIGVDLGRTSIKSVLLNRRGANRYQLNGYAIHPVNAPIETSEQLAEELKTVFKELGGSAKSCAVAVTSADAIIRIIEQPETPVEMLREALRLNGMTLLNQDCRSFVIDCDLIPDGLGASEEAPSGSKQHRYLVAGLPRTTVAMVDDGFHKSKQTVSTVQLGPICIFNAFEFAKPEIFENEAFMLVDIGHTASTVMVGVKKVLILVRSIEFGAKALIDSLVQNGIGTPETVMLDLDQGDEATCDHARLFLTALTRELSSSIGFFEGRREEMVTKIFISGGPARSKNIMQIMEEELHMPCEAWNPFAKCEIALSQARKDTLPFDAVSLNVATGAAAELLRGK